MTSDSVGYEYKELGECIDLVIDHRGKTPKKLNSDWVDEGIPTISAKNVNSGKLVAQDSIRFVNHEVYKKWMKEDVQPGDCFLVSEGATLGECLYWDNDYPIVLGQRIFCIRTNPEVLYPRYFYAYMTSAAFQSEIIGRATGSSVPGLRQTEVLKLKVKMLPMVQQIFIGDLLYSINTKIKTSVETNQTLEQIAQAIFKSWFVDFEPTRAKIAAKQNYNSLSLRERAGVREKEYIERAAMAAISGAVQGSTNAASAGGAGAAKTLEELDQLGPEQLQQLKTTAALFPGALVESELGEMPEGWEAKPLSQMVEIIGGGTPKRSEERYWGGDIPWFSVKDAPADGDVFVVDTEAKITKHGLNNSSTKLLPKGTTIISARGTVGRLALVGIPTAMNQSCYGVKGKKGIGACLNYLNLKEAVSSLQQNTHGAVFDTITRGTFDTVVLVESQDVLKAKFEELIESSFERIKNNLLETKCLSELRDTLLPKLLSGQLPIKAPQTKLETAC